MKLQTVTTILFFIILIFNILYLKPAEIIYIDNSAKLQELFEKPQNNVDIYLAANKYILEPEHFIESTCGNCEDPNTKVPATKGLEISGSNIRIIGPNTRSAIIHTNSGYGIYINNCDNCVIENITITGGVRDTCANATDAAIVVKNSDVIIRNNLIHNNLGDSSLVKKNIVGIMGICGRENSYLQIEKNDILHNSWDGIALFRGSEAIIENNFIDGTNEQSSPKGGRGVGIGVTWNAKAEISNNLIKRYWKGIGAFVDADVIIRNNIVEEMITWGISVWDAGKGNPKAFISNNIIYDTGAMGAAVTSSTTEDAGCFNDNVIVKTAQDSLYDAADYYGYQCAFAVHKLPENFLVEDNLFYNNRRATDDLPDHDLPMKIFFEKLRISQVWIRNIALLERSKFYYEYIY